MIPAPDEYPRAVIRKALEESGVTGDLDAATDLTYRMLRRRPTVASSPAPGATTWREDSRRSQMTRTTRPRRNVAALGGDRAQCAPGKQAAPVGADDLSDSCGETSSMTDLVPLAPGWNASCGCECHRCCVPYDASCEDCEENHEDADD